jgi:hypothetical protein
MLPSGSPQSKDIYLLMIGRVSMKVGDLIKWTDYREQNPVEHIGLLIKESNLLNRESKRWGDILILCNGQHVRWVSWQCEIINGDPKKTLKKNL